MLFIFSHNTHAVLNKFPLSALRAVPSSSHKNAATKYKDKTE